MITTYEKNPKLNQSDVEFTTLGSYEPGFIHLRVNTDESLHDIGRLGSNANLAPWISTFLHEYVHFLQDVTSTHGLLNFIHWVEYLKNANKQIIDDPSPVFSVPLHVPNDFNWHTNKNLKEIYRGREGGAREIRYLGYRNTTEQVLDGNNKIINVPKYYVDYYDNSAQTNMTCHFGSIHLKEYMAHAVQIEFDPAKVHDDLPYLLIELIVKQEVPEMALSSSLLIALCDASLMAYHPAQMFFHVLERMKCAPDKIPTNVASLYEFTYQSLRPEDYDSFESLYLKTAEQALEHFRDCLKGDVFNGTVQWFETLIASATDLRINRRGFFSRLVSSDGEFSTDFKHLIMVLGVPFTTNAKSEGVFILPANLQGADVHPFFPKVFQAICTTFTGTRKCTLYSICEAAENRITNTDCLSQPWVRVDFPKLCPYAQLWKTWGLEGKTPQS